MDRNIAAAMTVTGGHIVFDAPLVALYA